MLARSRGTSAPMCLDVPMSWSRTCPAPLASVLRIRSTMSCQKTARSSAPSTERFHWNRCSKVRKRSSTLKFSWLGSPSNEISACVGWHSARAKSIEDLRTTEMLMATTGPTADATMYPKLFRDVLGLQFKGVGGYQGAARIQFWRWSGARSKAFAPGAGPRSSRRVPIGFAIARSTCSCSSACVNIRRIRRCRWSLIWRRRRQTGRHSN